VLVPLLAYLIWESENMQKAVCEMDAIPKLAQIISVMEDGDLMYGIVDQRDKLKEVKCSYHTILMAQVFF